jgi:glycine/serine hydroxymethyltransferase
MSVGNMAEIASLIVRAIKDENGSQAESIKREVHVLTSAYPAYPV